MVQTYVKEIYVLIHAQKMLITLLAIATELHLLFNNKRTIHIYSIESVVKNDKTM